MTPEMRKTIEILWEVFGLPIALALIALIAAGAMSAYVDYQKQKGSW